MILFFLFFFFPLVFLGGRGNGGNQIRCSLICCSSPSIFVLLFTRNHFYWNYWVFVKNLQINHCHNMRVHSILTDSRSKAWKSNCSIHMCCCGINCDWCTCWNACIRWTITFSTNCSGFTSARMVIENSGLLFLLNVLTEESFLNIVFGLEA